jgi:hypothetical protein
MAFEPFMKQGLNFMGLIKPTLIIDIYYGYYYTTKWVEVEVLI